MDPEPQITRLLQEATEGDDSSLARLFDAIYGELRRIARSQRRRWAGDAPLPTTELVHEAYFKLFRPGSGWDNRGHFYAVASKAMRQILINQAERMQAAKRGGRAEHLELRDSDLIDPGVVDEILQLEGALVRLERDFPRQSQVVECRFYGGLDVTETAEALSISTATVKRDWRMAKAWLFAELSPLEEKRESDLS